MKHRGNKLEVAVRKSGIPITKIAKHLGVHRSTIYKYFQRPDLDNDLIIKIYNFIHTNITSDFPEIVQISEDYPLTYGQPGINQLKKEIEYLKSIIETKEELISSLKRELELMRNQLLGKDKK